MCFVTIQPVYTATVTLSGVKRSRRVLALQKQRFLTSLHSLHSFRFVRRPVLSLPKDDG